MTQGEELTIDLLRPLAARAGLELTDEELTALIPGVKRNLDAAKVVRKWAARTTEPQTGALPEGVVR